MKTYIPLDRLKRSRDSGSALYNMHPTDVLGRAGGVKRELWMFFRLTPWVWRGDVVIRVR